MSGCISKRLFFHLLIFLAMAAAGLGVQGQEILREMENDLSRKGYENLTLFSRGDTIFAGVTNRLYRWEPKAIADVLGILMQRSDSSTTVCLAMLPQGIPAVMISITKPSWDSLAAGLSPPGKGRSHLKVSMNIDRRLSREFRSKGANPSFNKLDFVVYPQMKLQLGNFDHPFESQFNIAPALEVSFLRGMNFIGQVIIPLQNDFSSKESQVRPGIIALNQTIRFPRNFFGQVSIGYFTRNRYGVAAETRKFLLNGKISVGFTGGFTGFAEMDEGSWNYTGIDRFTWFVDGMYRWARYDLTVKAGFGGFSQGEQGWRVDVSRQFREVDIGFFAMETDGFLNGGFFFTIPIPPGKYYTKPFARIVPESYFSWEYRAKGLSGAGKSFYTGATLTEFYRHLNPDYLTGIFGNSGTRIIEKVQKKR